MEIKSGDPAVLFFALLINFFPLARRPLLIVFLFASCVVRFSVFISRFRVVIPRIFNLIRS